MALQDCSVCFRDTKYVCIQCKIPICNMCSEPEFNEDVEGWVTGKQVGYCYGCTRKLKFKRKLEEGKRDDTDKDDSMIENWKRAKG